MKIIISFAAGYIAACLVTMAIKPSEAVRKKNHETIYDHGVYFGVWTANYFIHAKATNMGPYSEISRKNKDEVLKRAEGKE